MKRLLAIAILCLPLMAAEDTSKLVEASKEAKPKRKASKSKVITNKDVKNSKGKLTELPERPLPAGANETKGPSPLDLQDEQHRARMEAQKRLEDAAKNVADLEKKLEQVEQSYYEENDPKRRDEVIRMEFATTKGALEKARLELVGATDALNKIPKP